MSVIIIELLEGNNYIQFNNIDLLSDEVLIRRLRMNITKAKERNLPPPARCAFCREPIYLRRNPFGEEGYHFCHFRTHDPVLKKCPQRADHHANIELMRMLKYQGAKESNLHYRLKHQIAGLLNIDPSVQPESVKIEKTLFNEFEWRRPDVQAIVNGQLIAFEVQVSTEMANVIVAREHFYENFGSIIWVLPSFDPDRINQSQKDILTTNNEHLFVLNKIMLEKSKKNNKLHLEVWINWPTMRDRKICWDWVCHIANLSEITFENGHPYLLNVNEEEQRIRTELEKLSNRETEAQILARNRSAAREERKKNEVLVKNTWDLWWSEFQYFCDHLTSTNHTNHLIERLALENIRSQPTSTVSGLWLALHGVYVKHCHCSDFVIKALVCASKGKLDYGYGSWKYVAKGLIKK